MSDASLTEVIGRAVFCTWEVSGRVNCLPFPPNDLCDTTERGILDVEGTGEDEDGSFEFGGVGSGLTVDATTKLFASHVAA